LNSNECEKQRERIERERSKGQKKRKVEGEKKEEKGERGPVWAKIAQVCGGLSL
jgi:hypothetical protein